MTNIFEASSVFLNGAVTGREITKADAPRMVPQKPKGLSNKISKTTAPAEGPPGELSLAKAKV